MVKKISPNYTANVEKYMHLGAKLGSLDRESRRFKALGAVTNIIANAYRKGDMKTIGELRMLAQAAALDRQSIKFRDMVKENELREAYEINKFEFETNPPLFDSGDMERIFANTHKYINPIHFITEPAKNVTTINMATHLTSQVPSDPAATTSTVKSVIKPKTFTKSGKNLDNTINNPFSGPSTNKLKAERANVKKIETEHERLEKSNITSLQSSIDTRRAAEKKAGEAGMKFKKQLIGEFSRVREKLDENNTLLDKVHKKDDISDSSDDDDDNKPPLVDVTPKSQ